MKLELIINEIKSHCPTFENRVSGAAEYADLHNHSRLKVPAAYIIPLDDEAGPIRSKNSYTQSIVEGFAVVLVVSNATDERGQAAMNAIDDLRLELWRALLGWKGVGECYERIEYNGGNLLNIDRARLDYQLEFSAALEIDSSMTRQGLDLDALPAFESMTINIDHNADGRTDHTIEILHQQ
ncbi:hypothetical protein N9Y67_00055 [Pseudomonadota bacterium]|nr:hypothetical protein [Pseudomonadota bacterium]